MPKSIMSFRFVFLMDLIYILNIISLKHIS
jgi:hypothetical protein